MRRDERKKNREERRKSNRSRTSKVKRVSSVEVSRFDSIIRSFRPLTISNVLSNMEYGRKLRSDSIFVTYKNDIKVFVDKPNPLVQKLSDSRLTPFDYRGRKFLKTFYTYDILNKRPSDKTKEFTKYRVTISVINDKPKPTFNSAIQYYCSCDDYKFRMAYRNREQGILIETKSTMVSLGMGYTDPPLEDGGNAPSSMCKHIYSVFRDLKKTRDWKL